MIRLRDKYFETKKCAPALDLNEDILLVMWNFIVSNVRNQNAQHLSIYAYFMSHEPARLRGKCRALIQLKTIDLLKRISNAMVFTMF